MLAYACARREGGKVLLECTVAYLKGGNVKIYTFRCTKYVDVPLILSNNKKV